MTFELFSHAVVTRTYNLTLLLKDINTKISNWPDMSAPPRPCWVGNAASFCLCCRQPRAQCKPNRNHIFHQMWCWDSWLLNGLAWRMAWSCHSQVKHCGGQALFAHCWFLEPTPSAPQRWEHCWWWLTQISDSVSLFFSSDLHCCWLASQQQCIISLTQSPQRLGPCCQK